MKKKSKLQLLAIALSMCMMLTLLSGCGRKATETSPEASTNESATLVLRNGVIQTMVDENSVAQAVAIKDNEILYVGDDAGVESYISDTTEVVDLDGQMVTPGFMDGHLHAPGTWIDTLYNIDLSKYTTNEEYLKTIKAFVEANPDQAYYEGTPFLLNAYQLTDGSNPGPQKADLDAISTDKPIIIHDASLHALWVNSAALALAGITKDTPDPQGGLIKRDANGEPTGMLNDSAAALVTAVLPTRTYTDDQLKAALQAFQEECNSYGITGITDIDMHSSMAPEIIRSLESDGNLTLRMRIATAITPSQTPEEVISEINKISAGDTELVKGGTIKIFYDGVTEGGTAVFLEPYTSAAGKGDDWYGEPVWKYDTFENMVVALDAAGLQVHVHAIGDGAVGSTLNAYEAARSANGERDSRHTITHVCAITDDDIQRMADLKVVSALQFLWMYADPFYQLEAAYVGTERANAFYPTKNMIDAGCILSGASDGPVSPYNVLDEIEVGITRNSPYAGEDQTDMHRWAEQGLTAYQMLEAYTKNVAYENFEDSEIGTIEVGKKADLTVLSQNILKCDPSAISDTKVVYTISDGRIVFGK